jgi:hypothetical protein
MQIHKYFDLVVVLSKCQVHNTKKFLFDKGCKKEPEGRNKVFNQAQVFLASIVG